MSKVDRRKKRHRYAKPSAPRVIGANDNIAVANDNMAPMTIRGVTLTEGQAWRFADAERRIADTDLAVQRVGHRMLETLDREIDARLAAKEVADRYEELTSLEGQRQTSIMDVVVEAPDGSVAKTKKMARDGLETLHTAGGIDRIQFAAGLRYRKDYEEIDPEKKLTPKTLFATDPIPHRGGENWADKRHEIERRIWSVHAMIVGLAGDAKAMPQLSATHPNMRAIEAIAQIAGKGRNLSELASSGSVRDRYSKALKRALDIAAIVYGLT